MMPWESTLPTTSRRCRACWPATATTTRRTSRSPSAASGRTPPSASAACASTRTASPRPGPTARARFRNSTWTPPARGDSARTVLGAVRQLLRRCHSDLHRRGQGPPGECARPSAFGSFGNFRAGLMSWVRRAARLQPRLHALLGRRLPRPQQRAKRVLQRQARLHHQRREPSALRRQRARHAPMPRTRSGSRRPSSPPTRSGTDPRRRPVQHAQEPATAAGRPDLRPADQRRAIGAAARLLRASHRAAVPVDPGERAERSEQRRRRGRSQPQLRRRGCALVVAGDGCRSADVLGRRRCPTTGRTSCAAVTTTSSARPLGVAWDSATCAATRTTSCATSMSTCRARGISRHCGP